MPLGKFAPIHCGNDRVVVVAIRATGPNTDLHDLVEVAFVVADAYFTPDTKIQPFQLKIRPRNVGRFEKHWLNKFHLTEKLDPFLDATVDFGQAAELFRYWFEKDLRLKKDFHRIHLIAFDFNYVNTWLHAWLMHEYEFYIRNRNRDIKSFANCVMDAYDFTKRATGWTSTQEDQLRRSLGVENERPGDALHSCLSHLEMYRRLLGKLV